MSDRSGEFPLSRYPCYASDLGLRPGQTILRCLPLGDFALQLCSLALLSSAVLSQLHHKFVDNNYFYYREVYGLLGPQPAPTFRDRQLGRTRSRLRREGGSKMRSKRPNRYQERPDSGGSPTAEGVPHWTSTRRIR